MNGKKRKKKKKKIYVNQVIAHRQKRTGVTVTQLEGGILQTF